MNAERDALDAARQAKAVALREAGNVGELIALAFEIAQQIVGRKYGYLGDDGYDVAMNAALSTPDKWDGERSFSGCVFWRVRRAAASIREKQTRQRGGVRFTQEQGVEIEWVATTDDATSLDLERREAVEQVRGAIENMPAGLRPYIRLRLDGLKFEEIADRLGEPIGTVKRRMRSALKALGANAALREIVGAESADENASLEAGADALREGRLANRAAIKSLSEVEQEVYRLWQAGVSYVEINGRLRLGMNGAQRLLAKVKKALRERGQ